MKELFKKVFVNPIWFFFSVINFCDLIKATMFKADFTACATSLRAVILLLLFWINGASA